MMHVYLKSTLVSKNNLKMKYSLILTLLFILFISPLSSAATLSIVEVDKKDSVYITHIEAQINADSKIIESIITDYKNLMLINPYLLESDVLATQENQRQTVNMLTHACVLFICYTFRQTQDFHPVKNNAIYGRIIPDRSDFKEGWTRWEVTKNKSSSKQATTLIVDIEMVPDFFILPIIGTHHVKKKIIEITTVTINNLEKKAQKLQFSQ